MNHAVERIEAAAGNDAAIEALLVPGVMFGGVWFPDAECRKQFTRVGPISDLPAFSKCLTTLTWKESDRTTGYPDTFLFTYGPGLEIEVLVSREAEPRILWIGYVSRALASDNSPTVTQVALDARRIDPQPIPGSHALWAKVCVDETGAVTSVRPDLVTAAEAQEPLIAHLRAWKFQPFELDGIAAPVCAMMRAGAVGELDEIVPPVYTDEQGRGITVSATAIGERIDGNISITLDDEDKIVLGRMKGNTLYGKARMCLGTDGHVTGAWTVRKSGFPRYDAKWLAALKGWRYGPQSRPVCSYVDVIYTLK